MSDAPMSIPRVSVVLSVRNGEMYIDGAVRSILQQTFGDFELIVVDDGSTDGTSARLETWRRVDDRIHIVTQENQGLAASLNRGVSLARGGYIARHDADDLSSPERFERQVAYLDTHPSVAVVGTGADVIDESGATVGALRAASGATAVREGLWSLRTTPVHGSVMMRRDALLTVGGYREAFRVCQDYDLWLRLAERSDIDNLPERLYQWRIGRAGVYAQRRVTQLKSAGVALALAHERRDGGADAYDALRAADGDLDRFARSYPRRAFVYARWGDLLLRGVGNSAEVRAYLRRAVRFGYLSPWTCVLLVWTHLRLPWPGSRPLAPQGP